MLPCHARCIRFRLPCSENSLLLNLPLESTKSNNSLCSAFGHRSRTLLISFCTVQLQNLSAARSFATSGASLGELLVIWGSIVLRHVPSFGRGGVTTTTTKIFHQNKKLFCCFSTTWVRFSLISITLY